MSSKISNLTATTTLNDTDEFVLARSGANRKVDFSDIKATLTSKIGNVVYANTTYGNDSTGEVENPAKPYATITAALAGVAAYWDGVNADIPSSTNRITIDCNGLFAEDIVLQDYVFFSINNSVITTKITDTSAVVSGFWGTGRLIADAPGNLITLAYGSDVFIKVNSTDGRYYTSHASAFIYVNAINITATSDNIISLTAGEMVFDNCYSMICSGEPLLLTGTAGTVRFNNCRITSDEEVVKTPTGSNATVLAFRYCKLTTTGTNYDTINLLTNTGTNVYIQLQDCTLVANGTGNSIDAAQATNVRIYGSCQTNLTHDSGNVTLLVGTVANGRFLVDTNVE